MKSKSTIATWLLLLGVMFWGGTFVMVKEAVSLIDAYSLVSIRFFIATVILCVFFFRNLKNINRDTVIFAIISGFILSASFLLQTVSMKYTTASNAAFITGLCVVFVPLYVAALDRRPPTIVQTLSVLMATAGLALMTMKFPFKLNFGDFLALLCAVGFGLQLMICARLPKRIEATSFAIVQLLTVAIVTGICGLIVNKRIVMPDNWIVWRTIIYCATVATAYIYIIQARYQRYISEIKAVVIYSLEPLFAAIVAYFYTGEKLTPGAMFGGALIMIAMVVAELKLNGARKNGLAE
jgi:drug/metabolite transporter (DMT)-like permease